MRLTIEEAATKLGKSGRQVRYMIQDKRLPATKVGGHWIIESENLPLSEGQTKAVERKERQLRAAVEEGLGLPADGERAKRYSIRDLKAFQIALPIQKTAAEQLGAEHAAAVALRQVLEHLARGCHRFDRGEKAEAYRSARDAASLAVCELMLLGKAETDVLVTAIEQDLMAALAGLLRRLDRKPPR